jgi:ComF family protein
MLCRKCGAYFGEKRARVDVFCRKCDDHSFDHAFALGIYEKALAASVISLKSSPYVAGRITALLKSHSADFEGFDLVIPVPLSKERKLERGFNQAEVAAHAIATIAAKPVDAYSLARHGHTHIHRMGMDQKARELSVRNTFSVTRPRLVANKDVLLVDDVLTSGATASNCANVLKKNGASKVVVFTLARAVMR